MKRTFLPAIAAVSVTCLSFADQAVVGKRTWAYTTAWESSKNCYVTGVFPVNGSISVPAKLGGKTVTDISVLVDNLPSVSALSIPAGVSWGIEDKSRDTSIPKVTVANGNKKYAAIKNVVYNKKKTTVLIDYSTTTAALKLPGSVTTVASHAFAGTKRKAITLPPKLKTIENEAFSAALNLKKIVIPAKVSSIGYRAFAPNTTVTVAKGNKSFVTAGGVLFNKSKTRLIRCPASKRGAYVVPASVKEIDPYAFEGCTKLTKVTLGKNVASVGSGAFLGAGVKSFAIAKGNKNYTVAGGLLYTKDKYELVMVPPEKAGALKLPSTVATIADDAFAGCGKLTAIAFPTGDIIRSYGGSYSTLNLSWVGLDKCRKWNSEKQAYGASALKKITVAVGNPSYSAAGGVLYNKNKTSIVAFPAGKGGAYVVPAKVTSIQIGAFSGANKLSSVKMHAKVADIGARAFFDCAALKSVTLPSKLTSIPDSCFEGCSSLATIKLPATLKSIGEGAFLDCAKLYSITVPNKVTSIGDRAFGTRNRKAGLTKLKLPNKGVCEIAAQSLSASCKVSYTDKTAVYRIYLVSGGYADTQSHAQGWLKDYSLAHTWNNYGTAVKTAAFRGKATKLMACPFEAWGHTFAGWAVKPNTDKVKYSDKASVKNLAASGKSVYLYAVWKPITTTYKFNANGGKGYIAPIKVTSNEGGKDIPYGAVTRDGYWLDGWSTNPDGTGEWFWSWLWVDNYEKSTTVTLYAQWEKEDEDEYW